MFPEMFEQGSPVQPSRQDLLARSYLQRHMSPTWFAIQQCVLLQEILRVQVEQLTMQTEQLAVLQAQFPEAAFRAKVALSNVDSGTKIRIVKESENDPGN